MIQSLKSNPHTRISANSHGEFAKSTILRVQTSFFSLQSDRLKRNSKPVSVIRQCRRSFECFDASGGFLQRHRWKQNKKKNLWICHFDSDPDGGNLELKELPFPRQKYPLGFFFVIIVGFVFFLVSKMPIAHLWMKPQRVVYSDFVSKIDHDQVQKVEIQGDRITFRLKEIETNDAVEGRNMDAMQPIAYWTIRPNDIKTPYEIMVKNGVEFGSRNKIWEDPESMLAILFFMLSSFLVFYIYNCLPESSSKEHSQKFKQVEAATFVDVGGADDAKEELKEIVEYLRHPDWYMLHGVRPRRGVLLVGLPGTGKTLLAKAVAGEADVPFISCSANELGLGPSRVRDLFARARKEAPSIIYIDEIDAVGERRVGQHHENTFNQLLTEMDEFDSSSAVIVLGATNRADALDPALRLPGRFDGVVMVEIPDRAGREAILDVHVSKRELPVGEDVDLGEIASLTTGFTGADLANMVNKAALLAGRVNKGFVERTEFIQAVKQSVSGIEKNNAKLQGTEKVVVARHEAGHGIVGTAVAKLLPRQPRVEKISILPRSGEALGFAFTPSTIKDRYLLFIDELRGHMVTLLGGRAAEEVYSSSISTDAVDDTRRVTVMAYKAIAEYCLNENIGPPSVAMLSGGELNVSREGASVRRDQGHLVDLVQKEVDALLQSALEVAHSVVRANFFVLESLSTKLEGKERVGGEELQTWLKLVVAPEELSIFISDNHEWLTLSHISNMLKE